MTDNEILAIFAPTVNKTRTGSKKAVFTAGDGWTTFNREKHEYGKFHGKLGSMKRNNKGQARRQANGWTRYHAWNPTEVIAYKA